MKVKDIQLGTKLDIVVCDCTGKEIEPHYVSQLEEIVDSRTIIIAAPIFEGEIISIKLGSTLSIVFYDENGIYSFKGKVERHGQKGNIFVLKVTVLSELKKTQRREYFRFSWVMPVKYRVVKSVKSSQTEESIEQPFIEALTRDISGGGIGISTNVQHQVNDVVEIELELEGGKNIKALGKVMRSKVFDKEIPRYDTGIIFENIYSRDRDEIIKFIFEKQIKLKQKGMV